MGTRIVVERIEDIQVVVSLDRTICGLVDILVPLRCANDHTSTWVVLLDDGQYFVCILLDVVPRATVGLVANFIKDVYVSFLFYIFRDCFEVVGGIAVGCVIWVSRC